MIKTDCFAYENRKGHFKCTALHVDNCLNCHFYKTKEQLRNEELRNLEYKNR